MVREGMARVLDTAASAAGLDRSAVREHVTDEGRLVTVPFAPSEISRYLYELRQALRRYNRDLPAADRLRLRIVMHYAAWQRVPEMPLLLADPAMAPGPGIGSELMVVLADEVHRDVVTAGGAIGAADFRLWLLDDATRPRAWMYLPERAAHRPQVIDISWRRGADMIRA